MARPTLKPLELEQLKDLDFTGLGAWYLDGFVEALREVEPSSTELWGVYVGQELRAALPLRIRRRRAVVPVLAQYWGLYPTPSPGGAAGKTESRWDALVGAVDEFLTRRGVIEARLIHPPAVIDARPFIQRGWRVTPRYTYVVESADPGDYDSATRRQLKKARGLGLEVRSGGEIAGLDDLYRRAMGRAGLPAASRELVEALGRRGEVIEARRCDGSLSAALLLVEDEGAGYYALAARDPEGRGDGAPTLLVHHVMEGLAAEDRGLDFVGANTPAICRFKRGFGGRLLPYLMTHKVFRPALRLTRRLGGLLRHG